MKSVRAVDGRVGYIGGRLQTSLEGGPRHVRCLAPRPHELRARVAATTEVDPAPGASIRQTAIFDPAGLPGMLDRYASYPLHALVFRGLLEGIGRATGRTSRAA